MAKDVRVIIIKLADKLHNMSTLSFKKQEKQLQTAQECLDIFVPLAGKLGIFYFKSMLEDLALSHIDSELDKTITKYKVNLVKRYHASFLNFDSNLHQAVANDFFVDVKESISSNYAIYCLLKENLSDINHLQVPLRIDIICESIDYCYRLLGVVHSLYSPLSGHIKDFIASPKENNYQAIHTEVMDAHGLVLEIKIKTTDMDRRANFGVISYWLFDELKSFDNKNLQLLKQIKNWENNNMGSDDFEHSIKGNLHYKLINIFSKDGHSYYVNQHFTVLDFILHYHQDKFWLLSEVLINNKKAMLNQKLHSNQVIEPIFVAKETIALEWFGMVSTRFAKSLIKSHYKKQGFFICQRQDILLLLKENIDKNFKLQDCPFCSPSPAKNEMVATLSSADKTITLHQKNCSKLDGQNYFKAYYHQASPNIFAYSLEIKEDNDFLKDLDKVLRKIKATLLYFKLDNLEGYKKIVYIRIASSLNNEDAKLIEDNLSELPSVLELNKELLK